MKTETQKQREEMDILRALGIYTIVAFTVIVSFMVCTDKKKIVNKNSDNAFNLKKINK